MHHGFARLAVVVSLFIFTGTGFAQTDKRVPVPAVEAQAKALNLIREIYLPEMVKAAMDPLARGRLAGTFLFEARDTNDYPAGRYMLLELAGSFASQSGDVATALQAIEEKAQYFALPAGAVLQAKIDALMLGSKSPGNAESYHNIIDSALVLLEDALAQDDYPSSRQLLDTAENAARKLRNVPLVASLRKKQEEVSVLEKAFAHWKPFLDKLAKTPDDPDANLVAGIYYAFDRGNWERGLPLLVKSKAKLAKGSMPQLHDLAALELTNPNDFAKQIYLAAFWYGQAETDLPLPKGVKGAREMARINILLHSYQWYQRALADAPSMERDDINRMMNRIVLMLPPEYAVGDITTEVRRLDGHAGPVYCAAFSPDARKIVSVGADGYLRLWDVRTGKELRHIDGQSGRMWTVAYAPDGKHVVTGGFDGSVRLWDLASGREIRRFSGHNDYVRSVCVSRDGKFILSGGDDRLLRLWSIDTGAEVRSMPGHEHFVWSVALSRDGSRALSASLDKTVRVWDVKSGKPISTLRGHKDTVMSAVYVPGDRRALSGSTDRTMILWDLETNKEVVPSGPQKGYVLSVAMSPDSRLGLSGGQDHSVRLWAVYSGSEIRKLDGHTDEVWHVEFSSDGRLALSCSQDGTVRIWGGPKYR